MDPNRERIEADLRGQLRGEVRCDDAFVQMYASDASIYEVKPLGVVRPRGFSDVVACVQYAAENFIPLFPRGAGTGLAGESLGRGLVIDFSYSMRRILHMDGDRVRFQPGVTLAQLNRYLANHGRMFGPDPATSAVTTMGSVLAIDAAGSRWLAYGSARSQVVDMHVVLSDGSCVPVGREPVEGSGDSVTVPQVRHIVDEMTGILARDADAIKERIPRSVVNRCGYQLHDLIEDGRLDLPKLLAGSEGTLALTVEATVNTHPIPGHRAVALLLFDRLDSAARAATEIPGMGASACDLMDRRLLTLARETNVHYHLLIPEGTEAILLVETQGDNAKEVRDSLQRIVDRIRIRRRLAFAARIASDPEEYDLYWELARHVVPTLYRLRGSSRALPFVEDVAIPPAELPSFLVRLQNILKRNDVIASVFAHAGHGQLHIRPFLDLANPDHVQLMRAVAEDLYAEVLEVGGTISGEHGDGLSRTPFVSRQYGPVYNTFRQVKRLFDPHNLLNPGKVIELDGDTLTRNLRPVAGPASRAEGNGGAGATVADPQHPVLVDLQLTWNAEELTLAARACNGCGGCRTLAEDTRMCPIFRFAPREEASPRAKANIMRAVMTGQLDPGELEGDTLKEIADLCVNCHQCRLECPASVDIPKLMIECKAQYVATNGLRPSEAAIARLDTILAVGSLLGPLTNWALSNRQMRWLLDKTFGIAQGRKLPRFAPRNFLRQAARKRLTRPTRRTGPKVVYFVDLYAKWHDVQLANALVAVLEHNGVAVYVHPRQKPSAFAPISMGAIDIARKIATHNVNILAEAVRQGYHVVASEPASALCLTHEYLNLMDDDDTRLVAENTSEACTYLWRMHQQGKLRLDLKPLSATVGYHTPCYLRALRVGTPGENLLKLIPGITVRHIEQGCSGMAGTFGLRRDNYRSSLRAGWGLISAIREPTIQVGATECSSCKMQMEQGTSKPTIHPLKLLAYAYGLQPEISKLLSAQGEELVVT